MKKLLIILLAIIPVIGFSQISDNFEDGDISDWTQSIPGHWAASTDNPINGSYSLHHIFQTSITANYQDVISKSIGSINVNGGTTTWQFQIKYENTNPSGTNKWNVFLMADQNYSQMPSGQINGYVIGVNFGSLTDDILTLNKVTNGSKTAVVSTSFSWTVSGTIGVKVTRTNVGNWEVFVDANGGFDNLVSIGIGSDNTFSDFLYYGIVYDFTKTYCQKFWFDDFSIVGPPDILPPKLSDLEVIDQTHLHLIFSENLDASTSQTITNYLVDNSIGNPVTAVLDGADSRIIDLTFSSSFQENVNYSLDIANIEDESTNKINDTTVYFSWENIKVESIKSISETEIDVTFSKLVDQITAENANNYSINNSIGTAISATLDATDKTLVHLVFSNSMTNNQSYVLNVQSVEDQNGVVISENDFPFVFHLTQAFDIVVNELMIDVSPAPVALPENKYIELYNVSDYDIDLTNWTIQIGTNSAKVFPATTIESHGFVIICASDATSVFTQYGTLVPILTESQLTSTIGKKIVIENDKSEIIYEITYSPDWYNDEDKQSGGWSLERIDPTNICNQEGNWHASENYIGGTPGMENSVFASNQDTKAPTLISYIKEASVDITLNFSETVDATQASSLSSYILNSSINPLSVNIDADDNSIVHLKFADHFNFGNNTLKISSIQDYCGNIMNDTTINFVYQLIHPQGVIPMSNNQLKIYYSELVTVASGENVNNYSVDGSIGNPSIVTRDFEDNSVVHLLFNNNFEENKEYILSVSGISDANGNIMNDTSFKFIYHVTQFNDLVINEILYNPKTDCSDFVELYNRSVYPIDLQKIRIAKRNDAGEISNDYYLTYSYSVLLPDSFVVVTVDSANIKETYNSGNNFIQLSSMPSYSDDEGKVVILDEKDTIIDEFHYNDDMQFPLLVSVDGVSLERINYNNSTQDSSNWHSASESVGFATPGYKNSQYRDFLIDSLMGEVSLVEEVFSPDNDGYKDQLYINYQFKESGYLADIMIFDKNGILVRNLIKSQLLASNGSWIWDGLNNDYKKVNIGMYAIVVKVFDLNGRIKIYKLTAVVAGIR